MHWRHLHNPTLSTGKLSSACSQSPCSQGQQLWRRSCSTELQKHCAAHVESRRPHRLPFLHGLSVYPQVLMPGTSTSQCLVNLRSTCSSRASCWIAASPSIGFCRAETLPHFGFCKFLLSFELAGASPEFLLPRLSNSVTYMP